MQDASRPPVTFQRPASGRSQTPLIIGGTLIVLVAAALGMQVYRGKDSIAAEVPDGNVALSASAKMLNEPISRVNGTAITWKNLADECVAMHGNSVLEDMINRAIIMQACAEKGITVSEAEVNQEIVEISKKFGLSTDHWYKMVQTEQGLNPMQYRNNVVWSMLALRKLAGTEVTVTREMMQQAYTDNYGARVKARMIVLDNIRRAQEVLEMARANPDDFEALARDYSKEQNSKSIGGTIPPIRRFSGAHEEIRRAAFAMTQPGEISGILPVSETQFVILKFEGRTEPVEHDPKDVQAELHAELQSQEVKRLVGETFEKLQKAAKIDNYLAHESRNGAEEPAREFSDKPIGIELTE